MSVIIPYEEKLYSNEGAFISPNGEIIFTYGEHEGFANKYCNGELYRTLCRCSDSDNFFAGTSDIYGKLSDYYEILKKFYNYNGTREEINVFSSSKLTKEQLELYKRWLENYEFARRNLLSDFMVFLLSFDKVETVMRRCITTTNKQPHIRFYNYYLMDWYIERKRPMIFNEETKHFEYDKNDNWLIGHSEDKAAKDEIEEIKAKVLIKDRHLFFK